MSNRLKQERAGYEQPGLSRKGLSLEELISLSGVGVTRRTLQSWENGQTDIPGKKLDLLATFFGCSTDWLIGRIDRRNPDDRLPRWREPDPTA